MLIERRCGQCARVTRAPNGGARMAAKGHEKGGGGSRPARRRVNSPGGARVREAERDAEREPEGEEVLEARKRPLMVVLRR